MDHSQHTASEHHAHQMTTNKPSLWAKFKMSMSMTMGMDHTGLAGREMAKMMEHLLHLLTKLRHKGVRIVVNTRNPEEHNEEYAIQAEDAVASMQSIGIKVLYTVKHHRKLAIIDEEILWEGSLNILSQGDSCEIMRRTVSNSLAWQMICFTKLDLVIQGSR